MPTCIYCDRVTRLRPLCSSVACLRQFERDQRKRAKAQPSIPARVSWQPDGNAATFRGWR